MGLDEAGQSDLFLEPQVLGLAGFLAKPQYKPISLPSRK